MDLEKFEIDARQDREELAAMPKGINKPISWCNEHDCKMTTCFKLHYPDSSEKS